MTDKELNINILRELTNIANEIFANEINIAPGTYTAAELSKGKDAKGNVIGVNYIQTLDENLITRSVCIENFKCTFERSNIFYLIWKFEQILKVVQKNKVRFTKVEHVHSDLSFCVNITNEIKTLVKCVGDDPSNPALMNIYVDYKKGYMVASDAVRMKACKIEISDLEGESETNIFICPKDLKRISGACRISVSGKNVTITDSSGSVYLFYCSGLNYPKWESVVPYVSKSSCIKIANVKEVASFVKKRKGIMRISGKLGRTVAISLMEEYYDGSFDVYSEMTVNTETDISYDFSIMFKLENILPIIQSWNGIIFLNANYRPAAFGSIYNDIYFTLPYVTRNGTFEKEDFEIDRFNMVSLLDFGEKAVAEPIKEEETPRENHIAPAQSESINFPVSVSEYKYNILGFYCLLYLVCEVCKAIIYHEAKEALKRLKMLLSSPVVDLEDFSNEVQIIDLNPDEVEEIKDAQPGADALPDENQPFAVVPDIAPSHLSGDGVPGVPSVCVPLLDAVSFALWFSVRVWVVSARGDVPTPAANIGCSRRESFRIRGPTKRTTASGERLPTNGRFTSNFSHSK